MGAPSIPGPYVAPNPDFNRLPQPPPSPPMEDSRCSLPSIAKLLGLADAATPPLGDGSAQGSTWRQDATYALADSRLGSNHGRTLQQRGMPPTPPLGADASLDSYGSPSSKSISQFSVPSAPDRFFETTPPLDTEVRRHDPMPSSSTPRTSPPPPPRQPVNTSPFSAQPPAGNYYHAALQTTSPPQPSVSSLFYQPPFSQTLQTLSVPLVLAPSSSASPWQHHHYMAPSTATAFPQSQDRYVCQTCNKAFSRPSSLRIHSHSHTGEKPFKCPYAGCGKAFSVRSNMKRHERGCHSFHTGSLRASHAS